MSLTRTLQLRFWHFMSYLAHMGGGRALPRRLRRALLHRSRVVSANLYRAWRSAYSGSHRGGRWRWRHYLVIGHRGVIGVDGIVENTVPAFEKAFEMGADMVEVDVRRTKDGALVIHHDDTISFSMDYRPRIEQLALDEVREVDLGGGARVPTLEETIEVALSMKGWGAVYAELKASGCEEDVLRLLREKGMLEQVIVGSFDRRTVENIVLLDGGVRTALLIPSPYGDYLEEAGKAGAYYFHPCWERYPNPHALLTDALLSEARRRDLGVIVWHEERPDEIRELVKKSIYAICTNLPHLLL